MAGPSARRCRIASVEPRQGRTAWRAQRTDGPCGTLRRTGRGGSRVRPLHPQSPSAPPRGGPPPHMALHGEYRGGARPSSTLRPEGGILSAPRDLLPLTGQDSATSRSSIRRNSRSKKASHDAQDDRVEITGGTHRCCSGQLRPRKIGCPPPVALYRDGPTRVITASPPGGWGRAHPLHALSSEAPTGGKPAHRAGGGIAALRARAAEGRRGWPARPHLRRRPMDFLPTPARPALPCIAVRSAASP